MSTYETLDLVYSLISYGVTIMAFYFSVVSAYLIVAYLAGRELSKLQVIIINTLFLAFSFSLVYGTFNFFFGAYSFVQEAGGPIPPWSPPFLALIETFGIFAALFFMIIIRRK